MAVTTTASPTLGTTDAPHTTGADPFITLHFRLSQDGQRAAFVAGLNAAEQQTVQVRAADHPDLLRWASITPAGLAVLRAPLADHRNNSLAADLPLNADTAPGWLLAHLRAIEEKHAALLAQTRERTADNLAAIADQLELLAADAVRTGSSAPNYYRLPHKFASCVPNAAELATIGWPAALASARVQHEREQAQAEARRKAAQEAIEQRQADGEKALKAWANLYGSGRLRLMLEHAAGNWRAVARQEFVDAVAPDGYSRFDYLDGSDEDDEAPTEAALIALASVKAQAALFPAELGNARLRLVRDDSHVEKDEDDDIVDTEAQQWRAVYVDVTTPDADVWTIARRL